MHPLKGMCVNHMVDIWNYTFCHDSFMRQELIPQAWNKNKQESFSLGEAPMDLEQTELLTKIRTTMRG